MPKTPDSTGGSRTAPPLALHYVGGGFLPNVPARDLTPDDVQALVDAGHATARSLIVSGLYAIPGASPPDTQPESEA